MNPTQPSPADVAAVAAHMGGGQPPAAPPPVAPPAPAAPAPQLPPAPAPAPAANPYFTPGIGTAPPVAPAAPAEPAAPAAPLPDPFAAFGQPPAPAPAAPAGVEVSAAPPVAPPVAPPPVAPAAPEGQPPVAPAPVPAQPKSYQEQVDEILAALPAAPEIPKVTTVTNPEDPAAVEKFFGDMTQAIIQQVESKGQRQAAIQKAEAQAWTEAFAEYPSLEQNPQLRSTVQAIRMGNYESTGVYKSPKEAAADLLEAMNIQYKRGIVDTQVNTTTIATQPAGIGSNQIPAPVSDAHTELLAVQDGGETALANILAARIAAGQM